MTEYTFGNMPEEYDIEYTSGSMPKELLENIKTYLNTKPKFMNINMSDTFKNAILRDSYTLLMQNNEQITEENIIKNFKIVDKILNNFFNEYEKILIKFGYNDNIANRIYIESRYMAYHSSYVSFLYDGNFPDNFFENDMNRITSKKLLLNIYNHDMEALYNWALNKYFNTRSEHPISYLKNISVEEYFKNNGGAEFLEKEFSKKRITWKDENKIINELRKKYNYDYNFEISKKEILEGKTKIDLLLGEEIKTAKLKSLKAVQFKKIAIGGALGTAGLAVAGLIGAGIYGIYKATHKEEIKK